MDSEGHTPLLKAVLYGQVSAVQSLILAGVNLDIQDSTGTTAIHVRYTLIITNYLSLYILLPDGSL